MDFYFISFHFLILILQVGTHLMSATLRQLGFKIELVYANLDWQLAEVQLLKGVHVSFAYSFLSKSKLGLVGYHAPGFQDFHPDPFCMRKTFGALMLHLGKYKVHTRILTIILQGRRKQ
jgi:hypothetical protein